MIERILLWGLVLVLALGGAATGTAAVYTVDDDGPADFKTIQDAINKAGNGDTIQVKAGRYSENIILMRFSIKLK